jgi:prepilin-type N-terminal cleavage/methylation domain-containing protein
VAAKPTVMTMHAKSEICDLKSAIRNRRGWTLVELIIVSTVMTLLLAIAASVTHTMYRAQRSTRHDATSRRILTRLSIHLREDGHAARQAEVGPADGGGRRSRLTLAGGSQQTIQYIFHGDRGEIERTVLENKSQMARDTFPLPNNSSATFALIGQPASGVMVMKITQPAGGGPDGGERTLEIQAAIGLDRHYDGTHREGGAQE